MEIIRVQMKLREGKTLSLHPSRRIDCACKNETLRRSQCGSNIDGFPKKSEPSVRHTRLGSNLGRSNGPHLREKTVIHRSKQMLNGAKITSLFPHVQVFLRAVGHSRKPGTCRNNSIRPRAPSSRFSVPSWTLLPSCSNQALRSSS